MRYVLYHSNCYDGFGAAFAAWKKFADTATYLPVSYGRVPPKMKDATEIYIVDYCFDPETLLKLAEKCRVVVLDHHKTAEEKVKDLAHDNLEIVFDMNRSGALISWEYFHRDYSNRTPEDSVPHEAPLLIQHISDRDLWTFKLEGTKEIHAALVSHPMKFEHWDTLNVDELKKEGVAILRLYSQLVDKIVTNSYVISFHDEDVPVVNTTIAWSEVGQALLAKYPEAKYAMSFTRFKDNSIFSVRSREDFDCTEVSKIYGGGGHAQASGFKVTNLEAEEILSNVVNGNEASKNSAL